MSSLTIQLIGASVAGAALLLGTLSMALLPLPWGHGICGVWGCGPPKNVLAACHLSWLVVLTPPTAFLAARASPATQWRIAILAIAGGLVVTVGVLAYEALTWLPLANRLQADFFWHRWLFVLVTTVDLPVFQTLLLGIALLLRACFGRGLRTSDRRVHKDPGFQCGT